MEQTTRFNVNIDELRQFNPKLASYILRHPLEAIKMFEDQLNASVKGLSDDQSQQKGGQSRSKLALQN